MVLLSAAVFACSGEELVILPTLPDEPSELVDSKQEAFSTFGIERVIPVRIILMANDCNSPSLEWFPPPAVPPAAQPCEACSDGTTTCSPFPIDFAQIRTTFENVNQSLKSLGVQVYLSRIEKYAMKDFYYIGGGATPTWAEVHPQLQKVYPTLPYPSNIDPAWEHTEHEWLQAAAIRAGNPREIIIWAAQGSNNVGDGARVGYGAASIVAGSDFSFEYFWTHEFGHVLGLEHTMYPRQTIDPEKQADLATAAWASKTDFWDLYYAEDGSHNTLKYFSSRAEAQTWQQSGYTLEAKHRWDPDGIDQNCAVDANCTIRCCINGWPNSSGTCDSGVWGQTQTIGDTGIKGLGFTYAGDNPGAGVFRRGINAMMYRGGNGTVWNDVNCTWLGFSESQAEHVKKVLRSDVRIDSDIFEAPYSDGYTSKRHLLGDYSNVSGFDQLDFDGDGKRDIAVWSPPGTPGAPTAGVGRLHVLTSTSGYALASKVTVDFGELGDVPVPGNYNSDNVTDFAVLRRGNGVDPFNSQFYWKWCNGTNCGSPGSLAWGYQYDVPLPNVEFDGSSSTREIAVYRQTSNTTGHVHWRSTSGTASGSIQLPWVQAGFVPMLGLYDNDDKTDVVAYSPAGGAAPYFRMLLSSGGWSSSIDRAFPTVVRADALGASSAGANAPAVRHGGIPLEAEKLVYILPGGLKRRRVLRVWDAYTGNFYTMWNPTTSSTIEGPCQWGSPRDIPLAGPVDRDGDGRTDLAVFRPAGNGNGPQIHISSGAGCGTHCGSSCSIALPPHMSPKARVWAVTDMNGDGKGDYLILDPDSYRWDWYVSSGGSYVLAGIRFFGYPASVPL